MSITLKQLASPFLSVIVPFGQDPESGEDLKLELKVASSEFTLKLQREMTAEGEKEVENAAGQMVTVPPDIWLFLRLVKDWNLTDEQGAKLPITVDVLDQIEMTRLATVNQTIMAVLLPNLKPSQPNTES